MAQSIPCISETTVATGAAAVQLTPTLDGKVRFLTLIAHSANTGTVYVGSSSVTTSGANRGLPLAPGDRLGARVTPGATEFWGISAAAQNITVKQDG